MKMKRGIEIQIEEVNHPILIQNPLIPQLGGALGLVLYHEGSYVGSGIVALMIVGALDRDRVQDLEDLIIVVLIIQMSKKRKAKKKKPSKIYLKKRKKRLRFSIKQKVCMTLNLH